MTQENRDQNTSPTNPTNPTNPVYPHVTADLGDLRGPDGNAFVILNQVRLAMRGAGVPMEERNVFLDEATGGDYVHLLDTCHKYVRVVAVGEAEVRRGNR
jgi:hypothetical protein